MSLHTTETQRAEHFSRRILKRTTLISLIWASRRLGDVTAFGISSISLRRSSSVPTRLNYQQEDDLSLHGSVMEMDPDWYKEFVVDVLGKEFCDATWPLDEYRRRMEDDNQSAITADDSTPIQGTESTVEDVLDESADKQENIKWTSAVMPETDEISETQAAEEINEPAEEVAAKASNEVLVEEEESAINAKGVPSLRDTMEASPSPDDKKQKGSMEEKGQPFKEPILQARETNSDFPTSQTPSRSSRKRSGESVMESAFAKMTQSVFSNDAGDQKITELVSSKTSMPAAPEDKSSEPIVKDSPPENKSEEATNQTSLSTREPTKNEDDRVVVYRAVKGRLETFPLAGLVDLGYGADEIVNIESDALSVIIQDKVKRPRFGVPPQWKIKPGRGAEIRVVESSEAVTLLENEIKSKKSAARTRRRGAALRQDNRREDPVVQQKIKDMMPREDSKSEKESQLRSSRKNKPASPAPAVVDPSTSEVGKFVVYRNLSGELSSASLESLVLLGYQEADIQSMISDALAVVIDDEVACPRNGVPSRWKTIKGSPPSDVQIVESSNEARAIMEEGQISSRSKRGVDKDASPAEQQQARRNPASLNSRQERENKRASRRESEETAIQNRKVRFDQEEETTEGAPRRGPRQRERIPNESTVGGQSGSGARWHNDAAREERERPHGEGRRRRQRDRSGLNPDGSPKKIFNARRQLSRKAPLVKADPPSPNSKLWVDMDTFRNLLRTEADLRLKILGDDWAETVKQESDWRLNLYKDWLWTLHKGVGEPIVPPSRYERARAMQIDEEDFERPRRPRKPKKQTKQTARSGFREE